MGEFSVWHWLIVALVFLALFGYKKLPDAARSFGRSMRVFKAEMHGMHEDDRARSATPTGAAPQPVVIDGTTAVGPPPHAATTPPPAPAPDVTGQAEAAPSRGD